MLSLGPCHITRKTDHLNCRVYFHNCQCLLLIAKGNCKPKFLSHLSCSYRSILHTTVQLRKQGASRVWNTRYWTVHQKTCFSIPLSESEVTQSCLTLCGPMDCSLPGSSVHGIFQVRVLEWVAISFSRGSSWSKDWTRVSSIVDWHFTVWAPREVLNVSQHNYKLLLKVHLPIQEDAGEEGSIPGLERSPGRGNGNLFKYSCLENPMDRGAWQTTVHGVAESWTRLRTHF